ncbi:MAG: response regulator [Verrucomicrobiales bacterium]|nr:response regulator [Verrucomicrobiales bacterium]
MTNNASKVLIADDEPPNRELLRALLSPQGYELFFAVNGADAVEKAIQVRPDLILLDVMMPELNGWEACLKIRSYPELAEIPIVMITALDDRTSRLRGLDAGADDFLTKPFDREELTVRVRGITRMNRYRLLTQEREKFEQIIYLAPDAILIVDWQAKVRLANRAAQLLLTGAETKTLPSQTLIQLLAPGEATRLSDPLGELFAGGSERLLLETELLSAEGKPIPVSVSARYFPWDSQPAVQLNIREKPAAANSPDRAREAAGQARQLACSFAREVEHLLQPSASQTAPPTQPSWRNCMQQIGQLCQQLQALSQEAESKPQRSTQGPETVLLAVPSESWRALATAVLSEAGFTVRSASDPANAVAILTSGGPRADLVIVDQEWIPESEPLVAGASNLAAPNWIVLSREPQPLLPSWLSARAPETLTLPVSGALLQQTLLNLHPGRDERAKAA